MKKLIVTLLIAVIQTCYSQPTYWSAPVTFTHGHIDKNPSFSSKKLPMYTTYYWEFLIFERHSGAGSNVCVIKVDQYGPQDTATYLTNDNFINRNPCIGYGTYSGWAESIKYATAVWETNKNGTWDLYSRYFNLYTGWQSEFPVDSSIYNKSNPQALQLDSTSFAVVYERESDIIFKIINAQNHTLIHDTNLTNSISQDCGNPKIAGFDYYNDIVITYEQKKPDGKNAIYFTFQDNFPVWSAPDTVAYLGDNRNLGFKNDFGQPCEALFESDRIGNWNIYLTGLPIYIIYYYQDTLIINTNVENTNFEGYLFPIITSPDNYSYYQAGAYVEKAQDSIKVRLTDAPHYYPDSVTIGDTTKDVSIAMNNGLFVGDVLVWVIYNKDSLSFSNLYGKSKLIIIGDVKKMSNELPNKYTLHQNFPNPFNPVTNIRFDIPRSSQVKLIIYDALGREVATLVNEKLNAGSYETDWDGSSYPSGVYFYRVETNEFIYVRKMVMIK
ncbi:MAG: T9SS type A sorting domain-containing protein [Ignavibacteria bacterium]|nr:T9SS type A sorting domain-containing protein [Ignavibacteria bacterium]